MAAARSGWLWRGVAAVFVVSVSIAMLLLWQRRVGTVQAAPSATTSDTSRRTGGSAADTAVPASSNPVSSAPVLAAVPTDSAGRGAPASVRHTERIRVRVVNTTGVHGLARRMTFLLRDAGFDVVDFDSDLKQRGPETRILVHSAHSDWAEQVRQSIGLGTVVNRPDSLRALDLTVLIGPDWRPPAQPLRP